MKNSGDIKLLPDLCHDANAKIYYVNFARDRLSVTSYPDDAILAKPATRADGVAALA